MQTTTKKRLYDKYHSIIESGKDQWADQPFRTPSSVYGSQERLEQERKYILRGSPSVVALSCDVPKPGTAYSTSADGIPLLVIRDKTGQVRVFVNSCRHRATAVYQGRGQIPPAIACPYHAWTYKQDGSLFKRPNGESCFTGVPKEELGLLELPSEEKAGLVVARLDGEGSVDVSSYLGDFEDDIASYDLGSYVHVATTESTWDFNWKIAMDGFLEAYHLFALHKESIFRYMHDWPLLVEERSQHVLTMAPWRSLAEEKDPDNVLKHATAQHVLFPNFLLTQQIGHVETWQFFPDGDDPHRCFIRTSIYAPKEPTTEKERNYFMRNLDIVMNVVTTEDFPQAITMQQAIKSGRAPEYLYFGQNEQGLTHFHGMLEAAIQRGLGAQA